jgi:hypothetical protein
MWLAAMSRVPGQLLLNNYSEEFGETHTGAAREQLFVGAFGMPK